MLFNTYDFIIQNIKINDYVNLNVNFILKIAFTCIKFSLC